MLVHKVKKKNLVQVWDIVLQWRMLDNSKKLVGTLDSELKSLPEFLNKNWWNHLFQRFEAEEDISKLLLLEIENPV
jgi:hypothetical protein